MAFSGGTFSRLYDWTTDRDNGVKILASRMDQEFDGMATGLSTCILKDGTQTCTAAIPFAEGLTVPDNKTIILGTNSDITIQYDESTNDSLEIAANVEGAALGIVLKADQGDDNADQHKVGIADGGTLTMASKISGSFVSYLTHTPNSTVASSTTAVAGNLTVGGDLTLGSGAVISEAELEKLDGITNGTVAADKAVVVDSNKDIASFRNVTLTGELDAGSLDISGDADIDGTLEADAMTLNGTAITATATLDTGISNNNVPKFTSGVADDDFLRVAGTAIEGRSAAEVLSDIAAAPAAGSSNIVTTGALNSGSITSGFGAIDNGASAITTTGVITGGSLDVDNININGNTIGSTDTNGNITVDPNGSGQINLSANVDVTGTVTADGTVLEHNTSLFNVDKTLSSYAANNAVYLNGNAGGWLQLAGDGTGSTRLKINGSTAASEPDAIIISTNSATRQKITSGGDISFYADDGTTQGLFFDASTQRLGLGTTSPLQKLDIYGGNIAVSSADTYQTAVNIDNTDTGGRHFGLHSTGSINTAGRFRIYDYDANVERMTIDSSGNVGISEASPAEKLDIGAGSIRIDNDYSIGWGDGSARIAGNGTSERLVFSTSGSEAMRIDSSGNLLVGTTDTLPAINNVEGIALSAGSFGGRLEVSRDNSEAVSINRKTSDGSLMSFKKNGTTFGSIGVNSGTKLYLGAGDAAIRFDPDNNVLRPHNASTDSATDNTLDIGNSTNRFKDLYLSGGVYLGGTGSANLLDDYEEGTYTPAFTSSGASFSYSVQLGSYVKIGELVCCWFNITLNASPSGTTSNQVTFNVPFATKAVNASLYSGGHIGHYFNINLGSGTSVAYQLPSTSVTQIELKEIGDNIGENGIVASELNSNAVIRGSVMYRAAS